MSANADQRASTSSSNSASSSRSIFDPLRRCFRAVASAGDALLWEGGGYGPYHDPYTYGLGGSDVSSRQSMRAPPSFGSLLSSEASHRDLLLHSGGGSGNSSNGVNSTYRTVPQLRSLVSRCPTRSAVLLCGPNAGLYEYAHRQGEWLELYLSLGCDVILWNYPGYGRSSGFPSPSRLASDAHLLVSFLRHELGVQQVFVHGESIGGLPACALAGRRAVDLLIADRTLDSLPRTATAMLGPVGSLALRAVTRWTRSNAEAYLQAGQQVHSCLNGVAFPTQPPLQYALSVPRLLCVDPSDQVIDWSASLAAGVIDKLMRVPLVPMQSDGSSGGASSSAGYGTRGGATKSDSVVSIDAVQIDIRPRASAQSAAPDRAQPIAAAIAIPSSAGSPSSFRIPLLIHPQGRGGGDHRSGVSAAASERLRNFYSRVLTTLGRQPPPTAADGPTLRDILRPLSSRLYFLTLWLTEASLPHLSKGAITIRGPSKVGGSGGNHGPLAVLGPAADCAAGRELTAQLAAGSPNANSDGSFAALASAAQLITAGPDHVQQLPPSLPSSSTAPSSALSSSSPSPLSRCLAFYGLHPSPSDVSSLGYALACRWARGELTSEGLYGLTSPAAALAQGASMHDSAVTSAAASLLPRRPGDIIPPSACTAILSADSATWTVQAGLTSHSSPSPDPVVMSAGAPLGPLPALLLCVGGLTNGLGHSLGDAIASCPGNVPAGIDAVTSFLAAGLLFGWGMHERPGSNPSALLAAEAAWGLGGESGGGHEATAAVAGAGEVEAAAVAAVKTATPHVGLRRGKVVGPGSSSSSDSGSSADASPPTMTPSSSSATPFGGTSPHLAAAREAGITTALRRCLAIALPLQMPLTSSPPASGAGAIQDAGMAQPAMMEALSLLADIASLRPLGEAIVAPLTPDAMQATTIAPSISSTPPAASGSGSVNSNSSSNSSNGLSSSATRDALITAGLHSAAGLVVPLSCGHNAPWSAGEKALIARALVHVISMTTQAARR